MCACPSAEFATVCASKGIRSPMFCLNVCDRAAVCVLCSSLAFCSSVVAVLALSA